MKKNLPMIVLAGLMMLAGCVTPMHLPNRETNFRPAESPVQDATQPKDDLSGENTYVYRRFQLMLGDTVIHNARVELYNRAHAEWTTPFSYANSTELDGVRYRNYLFRIPKETVFHLRICAGIQGDCFWKEKVVSFMARDLKASGIKRIRLEGRVFDGRYFKDCKLRSATVPPKVQNYFTAHNRFIKFKTSDGREMIYDNSLMCVWYFRDPIACVYRQAEENARADGGVVPTEQELSSLFTPSREFSQINLHPIIGTYGVENDRHDYGNMQMENRLQDFRVWVRGGRKCVVFKRCYAPRTNPDQPEAALLIKIDRPPAGSELERIVERFRRLNPRRG